MLDKDKLINTLLPFNFIYDIPISDFFQNISVSFFLQLQTGKAVKPIMHVIFL